MARKTKSEYKGTSVLMTDAVLSIISSRSGPSIDRSTALRILLGWYDEIVTKERPELSENEWMAIRDALNGTWLLAEHGHLGLITSGLPFEIADSLEDGIAEKWSIDGPGLVKKLTDLNFAARVAVIDDVIRFWADAENSRGSAVEEGE